MNYLAYLAGPMEYVPDFGLRWREEYEKELDILDILCIVPNEKQQIIANEKELQKLKVEDLESYIKKLREIIALDLKYVTSSDFLIVRWMAGEETTGTVGEAQTAYLNNIPVYLVTNMNPYDIPGWFLACCAEVFHSKEDLFSFLKSKYHSI